MGDKYQNIAQDSDVTAQISKVRGDVTFQGSSRDASRNESADRLLVLLAELRSELEAARQRGQIDKASADAVEQELDVAAECVPTTDEKSETKFVTAMKKTKGLTEGLAGLTTKVAEAIAAVQGLQ
ncbi:MAG: hypothetical protein ACRDUV_13170 [Pseudonocardiaceae bacterium]